MSEREIIRIFRTGFPVRSQSASFDPHARISLLVVVARGGVVRMYYSQPAASVLVSACEESSRA